MNINKRQDRHLTTLTKRIKQKKIHSPIKSGTNRWNFFSTRIFKIHTTKLTPSFITHYFIICTWKKNSKIKSVHTLVDRRIVSTRHTNKRAKVENCVIINENETERPKISPLSKFSTSSEDRAKRTKNGIHTLYR